MKKNDTPLLSFALSHRQISIWAFLVLLSLTPLGNGFTTFIPRSQGSNTARELIGWQHQLYKCYNENYAAIASTVEYTRSFQTDCIAQRLFSTNRLTFAGSQFVRRRDTDIIADYFGLPTDFLGTLAIEPLIENVIIDLNLYFGLDDLAPGFYVRIHAPITHTRWTLGLDDCIACGDKFRGCTKFPDCYMYSGRTRNSPPDCPTPIPPARIPPDCPVNPTLNPPNRLRNSECTTQSIREALSGNFTFGDMVEPWNFGRFDFCPRSKTGLADIDFITGLNFIHNDYGHFGIFGLIVVPTGNRPKAKYIFEPLVGNGRHWEIGGGLSTHISLFENRTYSPGNFALYLDAQLTHVIPTHQMRSFDFKKNGLLSRYILLKEFNTDGNYDARIINAINFATRNCNVSVGLKADVSAKLLLRINSGWDFDIGYNFYFKERECIKIKTDCPCAIDSRIFGIKGLEGVCCMSHPVMNDVAQPEIAARPLLSTTQPNATMFHAELPVSAPEPTEPVSSVCFSWNSPEIPRAGVPVDELISSGHIIADTTNERSFISCSDLDPASAEQGRMLTNKVFAHLSYTFEKSYYCPHIGIGCEAEFDGHNNNALQQWGIWLKGGATF